MSPGSRVAQPVGADRGGRRAERCDSCGNATATYARGTPALAVAGGYALVVLGAAVFVEIAGGPAGVWLVAVTQPSSVLIQFVPGDGHVFLLLLTLGGLAQAWLLWLGLRGRRLS